VYKVHCQQRKQQAYAAREGIIQSLQNGIATVSNVEQFVRQIARKIILKHAGRMPLQVLEQLQDDGLANGGKQAHPDPVMATAVDRGDYPGQHVERPRHQHGSDYCWANGR
jgi:hypothetical protein